MERRSRRLALTFAGWIARLRRGDDRRVERAVGAYGARLVLTREIPGEPACEPRRLLGIGQQHLDDVGDGDGVVVWMPAVEIGDHGDGRVADLGLAGELGLRQIGHADHRIAEILVGHAFGERGELRPFDAHIGALTSERNAFGFRSLRKVNTQAGRDRMRHGHMRHAAFAEE